MSDIGFGDFSGGLWIADEKSPTTEQAGFAVPSNALLQADNLDFLPSGALRGRRGSSKYNSAALAGPVVALRRYYARPNPDSSTGVLDGADSDALGTIPWDNAAGVSFLFDSNSATVGLTPGDQSHYLIGVSPFLTNPIPADATITGVLANIVCASISGTECAQASIKLFVNFAPVGSDKSTGAVIVQGQHQLLLGGSGDLWGVGLTPADVNAEGFGLGFSVQNTGALNDLVFVQFLGLLVFYTAAVGTTFLSAHTVSSSLIYSTGAAGVFTPVTGGSLGDPLRRPHIVSWPQKGMLFLFDGVNPTSQFDGMEISTVPTAQDPDAPDVVGLAPRLGPYACLHKSRLWATDPGELSYSVYGSAINNERLWRAGTQLSVNDDRGGLITGLASFGDSLIIFKDTAIFRFLGDPDGGGTLTEVSRDGCEAPDSIAVTPFGVVYVGREGVWLTDGESTVLLSAAIRPLFVERDTEHTYPNAVGVYYPRRNQYWLHLAPGVDTSGYVLTRLTVPTSGGDQTALAWGRVPSLLMNAGTVWGGGSDAGELYLGDLDGTVWLRDDGDEDDGSAYTSTAVTAQALMDRDRKMGRVYRTRPVYRGKETLALGIRYDQVTADDVSITAGAALSGEEIQEPRDYLADSSQFGRFVSVSAASSEGPAFELHRIDLEVRLRGARVWR